MRDEMERLAHSADMSRRDANNVLTHMALIMVLPCMGAYLMGWIDPARFVLDSLGALRDPVGFFRSFNLM